MGFLTRLLGKEPGPLFEKAERALERDRPANALAVLAGLPDELPDELLQRRAGLERKCREALHRAAVASAAELEEGGLLEQAVDRLEVALEHCPDPAERVALEDRVEQLRARAEAEDERVVEETPPELAELGLDETYDMLVAMLEDEVGEQYEGRPDPFRQAYVDLNEGRAAEALEALDAFVSEHPTDPVGLLERGRCLLLLERAEEARADFEGAWEHFGDDALDTVGNLSVPLLWADAVLELKDHAALVERLAELARPEEGNALLSYRLAVSLMELERLEEAGAHLEACCEAFPREQEFPLLFAGVLRSQGRSERAIEVLERAIAPSCASASCALPAVHVPSLRLLARLHLDAGDPSDRVGELMSFVAGALGGELEWLDHYLLARHHLRLGDERGFATAVKAARSLLPADAAEAHQRLDELEAKQPGS